MFRGVGRFPINLPLSAKNLSNHRITVLDNTCGRSEENRPQHAPLRSQSRNFERSVLFFRGKPTQSNRT